MDNPKNLLRIRNYNKVDVEKFIDSIEERFGTDIRKIPQWEKYIKRLYYVETHLKKKIQDAKNRRIEIIEKLLLQGSRPSPFELTDFLIRTAPQWEKRKTKSSVSSKKSDLKSEDSHIPEEASDLSRGKISIAHPNSEIYQTLESSVKLIANIDQEPDVVSPHTAHFPPNICTNPHKEVSLLSSTDSALEELYRIKSYQLDYQQLLAQDEPEWEILKHTTQIKSNPNLLFINAVTLNRQTFSFSLTNVGTDYLFIKFKQITDGSQFASLKVYPIKVLKILPGLSAKFTFRFRLLQVDTEFQTSLFFRVGRNVYTNAGIEAFVLPIDRKLMKARLVTVSEIISMPPAYPWHINAKYGFPGGKVRVTNPQKYRYYLHILKRKHDFAKTENVSSVFVVAPDSESNAERQVDEEMINSFLPTAKEDLEMAEKLEMLRLIKLIVDEIIECTMEMFVFERTFLEINPYTSYIIPVYFTKPDHTGLHQCYYDFIFRDTVHEEVKAFKIVQLHAETYPHVIKIEPLILDMSKSPITFGYCVDHFTVINTHKLFAVQAKIRLTKKMEKIFIVNPMEITVPQQSSVQFEVRTNRTDYRDSDADFEFMSHFTIKILLSGYRSIFEGILPLYYEIIIPCSQEFQKVYNQNYFSDFSE